MLYNASLPEVGLSQGALEYASAILFLERARSELLWCGFETQWIGRRSHTPIIEGSTVDPQSSTASFSSSPVVEVFVQIIVGVGRIDRVCTFAADEHNRRLPSASLCSSAKHTSRQADEVSDRL